MNQFSVFTGAARYEFWMQIRRRALWITMILIVLLLMGLVGRVQEAVDALSHLGRFPLKTVVVYWTNFISYLLPVGFGALLADRLPRDRRTKVEELFTSMPGSLNSRMFGKYLGAGLATLIPIFAFYLLGVCVIIYETHNLMAIPLALATFSTIILPGLLFVGGFSIACTAFLWTPLYQFLFAGYWFWGNIKISNIPTISDFIPALKPMGMQISLGFFGLCAYGSPLARATPLEGAESLLLLVGLGFLAIFVLCQGMKWYQAHQ